MDLTRHLAVPLAALLLAGGCGGEAPWNVLLVTLDTTRADRLSCYGYHEPTTPTIDALADEGTLFTQAFCTNPITLPSHASILTGTYPMFHGTRDNSTFVVREGVTTLAEVLDDGGYDTGAVIGAFVLDGRFNLDQGFDYYNDDLDEGWSRDELAVRAENAFGFAERKANLVTVAGLEWLRQPRSKPFFMWLHYFDPHQPVNPPEPHHSRFTEPYTAEIAYADEQLGHIIEELKRQGEYERTLIVVTSDHGEGLSEHNEPTHSLLIFDSTMHVPLIVRMPGGPSGRRVDPLASTVDIMPTVLDLLGREIPEEVQGHSLASVVRGGTDTVATPPDDEPRAVYMESLVGEIQCKWGALRGLRTAEEKLIHGPKPRYYRVGEDPREVYDLAGREPVAVTRMTDELERRINRWRSPEASGSISVPDQETLQALGALGYIAGGGPMEEGISDELGSVYGKDDPNEKVWLFDLLGVAGENIRMGYELAGIQQLEEVISQDPENPAALTALGKVHSLATGRLEVARDYLERSIAVDPRQEEAHFFLCRILRAQGDLEGARRHAEIILDFQPLSIVGRFVLSGIYEAEGDLVNARIQLHQLLEIHPTNIHALLSLATSYAEQKEHDEAGPYFKRALDLDPNNPIALYKVGIWHFQGGRIDDAIISLSRSAELNPNSAETQYVLGRLLFEQKEMDRARDVLSKALELATREDRRQSIQSMLARIDGSS